MDLRYFLLFVIVSVSLESIDGQVTQCTTAEYRAVVLGLEALRAQFKTEIANLMTIITTMNETIQDLLPEEITSK